MVLFSEELLALPQGPANTPFISRMQGGLCGHAHPPWRLWSALCGGEYTP